MSIMMKIILPHRACFPPFQNYKSKGPYSGTEGRLYINLLGDWGKRSRKTFLYARYLLIVHTGKIPPKGYDVDHKNNNPFDDRISNLQWLPKIDNIRKRIQPKTIIKTICPSCGKEFTRPLRKTKDRNLLFCSKSCSYTSFNYLLYLPQSVITINIPGNRLTNTRVSENWEKYSSEIFLESIHKFTPSYRNTYKSLLKVERSCKMCKTIFIIKDNSQIFCSKKCSSLFNNQHSKRCSDEQVIKSVSLILDKTSNWVSEGKKLGISDNGLRKRAKYLNLI